MNVDEKTHRILRAYQRRHERGFAFVDFLRLMAWRWVLMALIGVAVYVVAAPTVPMPSYFAIGMLVGGLLRDVNFFRGSKRMWPVVDAITDWPKIDELIGPYPVSGE